MKHSKLLPILAIAGLFMLQSCDDELFDITENFTYEHEFVIYSDDSSVDHAEVIDFAAQESLIKNYGSKIKKIEVESIHYWIKEHNGSEEQTMQTVSLSVANDDGSDDTDIISLQDINLHQLLNNSTQLNPNANGVLKLSSLMESPPHSFMLLFRAAISEVPADFTIVFSFDLKMTANPLK